MWPTHAPSIAEGRHPLGSHLDHLTFLRRYARRLLRDVRGREQARALPVLRRLIAQKVTHEIRLSELHAIRVSMQLKHILHMIARELGFPAWENCKQAINQQPDHVLDRYRIDLGMFDDYPLNWFADAETARQWQREHGGYLIAYGGQMVVVLS
ncbi:hypothetical protein [uncultured Oxalicibacterium sp.]|uniref:hypothetical protein n=1 Tax=uncultured Oxalicibacterium sp. TaxID=1168540 RepID=UPI0025E9A162|nr:hypothetical protein [uncultured Oxalicibacterium sp.]